MAKLYDPNNIGNIPTTGLVRRYDFDSVEDLTCKISGVKAVGNIKHTTTEYGHVLVFDNSGTYLDFDSYLGENVFGTNNFCISMWVAIGEQTGDGVLLKQWSQSGTSNNSFYFTYNYITNVLSGVSQGKVDYTLPKDFVLRHLLINVSSSQDTKIYLDGVLHNSGSINFSRSSQILRMGNYNTYGDTTFNFNGQVKLFRVYNRALTQNEINTLYNEIPDKPEHLSSSNWTVFNSGSVSIDNLKVIYDNNPTTQGALLSPYILDLDTTISFDIQMITDYQNRQHAGCWLYDYSKNNWFRYSFLDNLIHTVEVINQNPKSISSWYNEKSKILTTTFNSKKIFKMRLEINKTEVKSYLDDVLIDTRTLNFVPYGFALFSYGMKFSINNLNLIRFDLNKYKIKPTFSEQQWWNIIPDVNCIFALDNNSIISGNNTFVNTSVGDLILETEGHILDNIVKEDVGGYYYKDFQPLLDYNYIYKSLKINKYNLVFNKSINIPNEFTFILKTKLITKSVFLNVDSIDKNNWGLTYETYDGPDHNAESIRYNWRIAGQITGQNYTYQQRQNEKKFIDYVILKGNISNKNVSFITSYGTYTIPTTSNAFTSFLNLSRNYSVIGYPEYQWSPNANIIAYGLFDKDLNLDQINTVMNKIDEQFLIKKIPLIIFNNNTLLKETSINVQTKDYVDGKITLYSYYKPYAEYSSKLADIDNYTTDLKIKEYSNIQDHVYEEGIPISTKLFLLERSTGNLVSTTTSNTDGYFEFKNIDNTKEYIIYSIDGKYTFDSIIKDYNLGNS